MIGVQIDWCTNLKKKNSLGMWKTMIGMWETVGKGCGRPKIDAMGLKQNFNKLTLFIDESV